MATAFRSSQSVTNATAGTSVTVSKPSGIVDTGENPGRDQLIAFIATVGAPSITAPAGWTLITSIAASTPVTIAAYRKLASSEGASWTWTLGASQRNWGWVGAYTGVDPVDPLVDSATVNALTAAGTRLSLPSLVAARPAHGQGVAAGAATRTASGVATTWTHSSTSERADLSTNAGSGTDIAGVVGDGANTTDLATSYAPELNASQAQTAGVGISLTLLPYFVPYDGGVLDVVLEWAPGADPDGDQDLWTWESISGYLSQPDVGPAVSIRWGGRPNGSSSADPTTITFTLLNLDGEFTHPTGDFADNLTLGVPFRAKLRGIGVDATGDGYHRGTAFLSSAKPRWDTSLKTSVIDVVCRGMLWRVRRNGQPLHSAAFRSVQGIGDSGMTPIAHWPLEAEAGAYTFPSAVAGQPAASYAEMSTGGDSSFPGSDRAARLSDTSWLRASLVPYAAASQWSVVFGCMVSEEPAAETTLMSISTTSALTWHVILVPGTNDIKLQVINSSGSSLLSISVPISQFEFYDHPVAFTLTTFDDGADIDYVLWVQSPTESVGINSTLAGAAHGNVTELRVYSQEGLAGAGLCHLAVYGDPALDPPLIAADYRAALVFAHAGEWPWSRFQRLCMEEGLAFTFSQSTNLELTMGPQQVDTLANLLAECEVVEGCVMHDTGTLLGSTGLLDFPALEERYNRTTDLTLSMLPGSGQVSPGFEPSLDDQDLVNDVDVTRSGGSTVHASDADSIARQGTRSRGYTVNTEDDAYLADLAGMRLAFGTVPGYRFPVVGWDLRNRNTASLAEAWLACRIGFKLDITNPPSQYPPDTIEAFVEAPTEELGSHHWRVRANLSQGAIFNVGILAEPAGDTNALVGHLESTSVVLAEALDTTETAVDVTASPLITTTADDFPLDVFVGGEEMTVTNCVGASNPQTLTVVRSVNTVVKTHDIGDAITLADPLILAM